MNAIIAKHFVVTGKVQGVFFRASTLQQANQMGIRGYAKNLVDGSVEILAIGAADSIVRLEQWLWQGPPVARVDAVQVTDVGVDLDEYTAFVTL